MAAVGRIGGIIGQPSRFAIIGPPDSDSDEENSWHSVKKPHKDGKKQGNKKGSGQTNECVGVGGSGKSSAKNAKRRAKKRNQENSSSDQLGETALKCSNWSEKDKTLVEREFKQNLELALMNSILEKDTGIRKAVDQTADDKVVPPKCKKGVTLSLQDFHSSDFSSQPVIDVSPQQQPPQDEHLLAGDADFFVHAEKKLQQELQKAQQIDKVKTKSSSKKKKDNKDQGENESVRVAQLKDDLEKKDEVIMELKEQNNKLEVELKEVKRRNQVLYKMLSKGEISSKSDLLQQLEELTTVKNELSDEVVRLHKELEQERSSNKTLKSELVTSKTRQLKH